MQNHIAPLASLLSKSEKAIQKLKSKSWQYLMLERNIAALRLALAAIQGESTDNETWAMPDRAISTAAIESMIEKTAQAMKRFALGTSQHSLLKNRLEALHAAKNVLANSPRFEAKNG